MVERDERRDPPKERTESGAGGTRARDRLGRAGDTALGAARAAGRRVAEAAGAGGDPEADVDHGRAALDPTADVDVLIVGGGPVGLVAAIEARLAGLTVAIAEPRGGGQRDRGVRPAVSTTEAGGSVAGGDAPLPVGDQRGGSVSGVDALADGAEAVAGPDAGPASSLLGLARPGDPIDKACGEGLMPGALPLLGRLGVAPHGLALRGVRYTDGARSVEHRFPEGAAVGLGVRRTELHRALAERAAGLGVTRIPVKADAVVQDATGVTAAGIRASWLIAADGLHSTIAREVGLARPAPRRRRRYGLRRHARVTPWSELIEVHWTPRAEIYVTPVDDRLVGIAVLARQGVGFDEAIAEAPELVARLAGRAPGGDVPARGGESSPGESSPGATRSGAGSVAADDAHPLADLADVEWADEVMGAGPFRQRTRRRVAGRVLLVGDATGYVDAITGEGLRLGFDQARAAVKRIRSGDAVHYEADWFHVTRQFRRVTGLLAWAATVPALRRRIVPLAASRPAWFGAVVDRLAR
ncbi:FAD-dependent monooxygenase [Schumannella soli]|uniref:FAD-dependent monooxygenase n=1 Tax=Schumannella soli TaxID=2590779 RepID=UPI001C63BFE8|nr:FAD-dependent monooxygenase [Schumannella soli]